jgi:hypothetical protein
VTWRGSARRAGAGAGDDDREGSGSDLDDDDDDDDDDDEVITSSSESESDGRGSGGGIGRRGRSGSRSSSHMGSVGAGRIGSLPNSLNPRPRKLTRANLGPRPLFGSSNGSNGGRMRNSPSPPNGLGADGFSVSPNGVGTRDGPVVGFGLPKGGRSSPSSEGGAGFFGGVPSNNAGFFSGGSASDSGGGSFGGRGRGRTPPRAPRRS